MGLFPNNSWYCLDTIPLIRTTPPVSWCLQTLCVSTYSHRASLKYLFIYSFSKNDWILLNPHCELLHPHERGQNVSQCDSPVLIVSPGGLSSESKCITSLQPHFIWENHPIRWKTFHMQVIDRSLTRADQWWDGDVFLHLVTSATCHPTLSQDRERIHYKSTPHPISQAPTQTLLKLLASCNPTD